MQGHMHAEHIHRTAQLKPSGYDLGMMGVIVHVLGDAFNNIAVIIAALVIWLVKSEARFYADPALSTVIAIMILASAIPLSKAPSSDLLFSQNRQLTRASTAKRSGTILLQSAPPGVRLNDVKHDLEMVRVPGDLLDAFDFDKSSPSELGPSVFCSNLGRAMLTVDPSHLADPRSSIRARVARLEARPKEGAGLSACGSQRRIPLDLYAASPDGQRVSACLRHPLGHATARIGCA